MAVEELVLPLQCRKTVLELAHEIPLAGHLGKDKTARRILQRFYWPTLYRDVTELCRTCAPCQKTSTFKGRRTCSNDTPPSHQRTIPNNSNGHCGTIAKEPIRQSLHASGMWLHVEAVALRSIDAESIAEELIKLFARVGIPKEILTDQGSNFTSQLLAELYRMLHVHLIRTSPYHPQTDGLVERFNQTLKSMLRTAAVQEGKDWDKMLFAY